MFASLQERVSEDMNELLCLWKQSNHIPQALWNKGFWQYVSLPGRETEVYMWAWFFFYPGF